MDSEKVARYGAASGIVFAVLLVVGFFLVIPDPPDINSSAQTVGAYYIAHKSGIRLSLFLVTLSLPFYLWFLGSLTSALRRHDEGSELQPSPWRADSSAPGSFSWGSRPAQPRPSAPRKRAPS